MSEQTFEAINETTQSFFNSLVPIRRPRNQLKPVELTEKQIVEHNEQNRLEYEEIKKQRQQLRNIMKRVL
jgi:hypothetical protein